MRMHDVDVCYGDELHPTRSSALLRVAGQEVDVQYNSRTVHALRAQSSRRASAARIAWHTLPPKAQGRLPPGKPKP